MATTGVLNGTSLKMYVYDSGSPGGWAAVAYGQSASVTMTQDARDTTSKDSGGKRELGEGKTSWNMSADALLAWDATQGVDELVTAWNARTKIQVKFTTDISGDSVWTGYGYITNVSANSGVEDNATYSVTVEGTGALSVSTVS